MLFTDIIFAFFLPVVFCLYWFALKGRTGLQNALLLSSSYLFYGWWDWRFLGLIILTSATTYFAGMAARGRHGKFYTTANITLNLGILCAFKYFNFFSENLVRLLNVFGLELGWFTIDVLLPVGISFYTFQAIGYSVDVYKGKVEACRNPLTFFTFIAYFPQLVAGPIERASQLLPQISHRREWNWDYAVTGLRMILFGLFKKLCIADYAGSVVNRIFADFAQTGTMSDGKFIFVTVVFCVQIYCDFSAYSEIARGTSRLLGIELMANFRFPLFSRNIIEIWHRWHISLTSWLRDYVYIPLGGNRRGRTRTAINLAAVFLLSGLWHGAGWNFVLWGAFWAILYPVAYLLHMPHMKGVPIRWQDCPAIAVTFLTMAYGFFIFRCEDMDQILFGIEHIWLVVAVGIAAYVGLRLAVVVFESKALRYCVYSLAALALAAYLFRMAGQHPDFVWILFSKVSIVMVLFGALIEWKDRNMLYPLEFVPRGRFKRMMLYQVLFLCVLLCENFGMAFIYFSF